MCAANLAVSRRAVGGAAAWQMPLPQQRVREAPSHFCSPRKIVPSVRPPPPRDSATVGAMQCIETAPPCIASSASLSQPASGHPQHRHRIAAIALPCLQQPVPQARHPTVRHTLQLAHSSTRQLTPPNPSRHCLVAQYSHSKASFNQRTRRYMEANTSSVSRFSSGMRTSVSGITYTLASSLPMLVYMLQASLA